MKSNTGLILGGAAIAALFFLSSDHDDSPGDLQQAAPATALTPTEFVRLYYPYAKQSQTATGVPALVTMSQAALESGWGKHAPGFNFFGIKPGKAWTGAIQYQKTWECGKTGNAKTDNIKDQVIAVYAPSNKNKGLSACRNAGQYSYRTMSPFRAYANAGQSFLDHGQFLKKNDRYKAAFSTTTPEQFVRVIATAGYATTPGYADTAIQVMNGIRTRIAQLGIGRAAVQTYLIDSGEPEKSKFPIRIEAR